MLPLQGIGGRGRSSSNRGERGVDFKISGDSCRYGDM